VKIIGISGKSGSGKDWLGTVLRDLGYLRWALAWPMKNEAVGGFFSEEGEIVFPTYDEVHNTKPARIREHLQQRGTEQGWMRFGRDYWLRIADAWLRTLQEEKYLEHATGIYLTDVRLQHEAEWVRAKGGKLVRLEGRGGLAGAAATHISEVALDGWKDWDMVLDNGPDSNLTRDRAARLLWAGGIIPAYVPLNPGAGEELSSIVATFARERNS
jgi:hypothetical protein